MKVLILLLMISSCGAREFVHKKESPEPRAVPSQCLPRCFYDVVYWVCKWQRHGDSPSVTMTPAYNLDGTLRSCR